MAKFTVKRTNISKPENLETVSRFLFKCFDGANLDYSKSWRRLWKKIQELSPGDVFDVEFTFSRSSQFHKRHMAMESAVFNAQDQIKDFETFRDWLKIGAGFVIWMPVLDGEVYPIPKSISYSALDQDEFERFHNAAVNFLLGLHAPIVLWPHLSCDNAQSMMDSILESFI